MTLITNKTPDTDQVVARVKEAGSETITQVDLDLAWPASVYSMSHVAIPAPLDDPLYGLFPAEAEGYDLHLGNIQLRGERNLLKMSEANLMRLRSNPFFDFVETKIAEWIITDLE